LSGEDSVLKGKKLTDQEHNVLVLISQGKTNKEIAIDLFLSEKTVRNYVSTILNKLELSNRSQAGNAQPIGTRL